MAERHVAIEHQTLALVEHRRVRRVVVGAIGAADHDHADRRLLRQHGADLHRRGLRAQHRRRPVASRRQIERVVVGARRMVRRNVQRAEIVPVALDIRALGDRAAHGAEDRGDLLHGAADRMDQAGLARARRQRWVDAARRRCAPRARRFPARARRASIASVSASFSRFSAAPRSRRCSGGVLPMSAAAR